MLNTIFSCLACDDIRRLFIDMILFSKVSFYTAAPLSLSSTCAPEVFKYGTLQVAEFIVKGRARMPDFEFDWWGYAKPLTKLGWFQWTGAAIFFWGWIHQYQCHAILVRTAFLLLSVTF